ncbi:hypothetical protein D917_00337, partial [Trichinella nativa]
AVELVDVGNQLPELVRSKGFHHWKVLDAEGNVYASPDEVPDELKSKIHNGLFPPDESVAEKLHLERCLRIFPHHQNTGGFFIAVLRKVGEFSWSTGNEAEIINAGLRTFSRCSVSDSVRVDFRLVQDGLRYVIPLMSKRLVNISKDELLKLIKSKESILLKDLSDELHSQLKQIGEGSAALVCGAENAKCTFQVASWLGRCSVAPHLDKENRAHFLFMLNDLQAAYDMYKGNGTGGVDAKLEAVL